MIKKFKQFYEGKLPLGESFWIYLILVNFVFRLATMMLINYIILIYPLLIAKIVYGVFAIIGVWRSATNYSKEKKNVYWGPVAKITTVAIGFEMVTMIFILLVPIF